MTSEEGLTIENVDLVWVFAFDLGAKVDAIKLGEAFSEHYPLLVEARWNPPNESPYYNMVVILYRAAKNLGLINEITLSEFIHKDKEIVKENKEIKEEINRLLMPFRTRFLHDRFLDPQYLMLGRYSRLKLIEFEAEVAEPDKSEGDDRELQVLRKIKMMGRFRIEPYLLIHNAGVCVVTTWINLKGKFTTDEIITLEDHFDDTKLIIEDAFGNRYDSVSLFEFVMKKFVTPLMIAVLFKDKDRYGDYNKVFEALGRDEISEDEYRERQAERLRVTIASGYVITAVREIKCGDGCTTLEDIVKRHVKEIAGILTRALGWRQYRIEGAENDLGKNLSVYESYAIYMTLGASLFLSSLKLVEELIRRPSLNNFNPDPDIEFRQYLLFLVNPVEFLMLWEVILDAYDSFYQRKLKEFEKRKSGGEVVSPSDYMVLRRELTDALEEYSNVFLYMVDPYRSILEYGKKTFRLTERVEKLRLALDELAETVRTHYEERITYSQLMMTFVFGVFGIVTAVEVVATLFGLQGVLLAIPGAVLTVCYLYRKLFPRES